MKPRIYVDTSVIGGCFEADRCEASQCVMDLFKNDKALLVLSDMTLLELSFAPEKIRDSINQIPMGNKRLVELTEEIEVLARHYIEGGILPLKSITDARHIAVATVSRSDLLVSWNFKHMVNIRRIRGFNSINIRYGYPLIEIRSPLEVIEYED